MLSHRRYANYDWMPESAYISFAVLDRNICEDLDASIGAWDDDEYYYQLHDILQ